MTSTPDFFESAAAKYLRAIQLRDALIADILQTSKEEFYHIVPGHKDDFTEFWANIFITQPQKFVDWSLRLGDCVHNLRASLDHALFGIALTQHWPASVPARVEGSIQFPIFEDTGKWAAGLWRLGALAEDSVLLRVLESLQPYSFSNPPLLHPLWILSQLDNQDKHRLIPFGFTRVLGLSVRTSEPSDVTWKGTREMNVINGGEIYHIFPSRPAPELSKPLIDLVAHPAIQQRTLLFNSDPADAAPGIDWLLAYVSGSVGEALSALRPFCS